MEREKKKEGKKEGRREGKREKGRYYLTKTEHRRRESRPGEIQVVLEGGKQTKR